MKLKYFIASIILCGAIARVAAQDVLQAYIDTALKNNPTLQAYRMQSQALQQKIDPAKTLPDPVLFGGIMNLPVNFGQDMMTMKQIGMQQSFSVAGRYVLKSSAAERDFNAAQYDIDAQQLELINQVKQQYYDLYAQAKKIETAQSSLETIKNYLGIANTRYSTGLGTQQDILKAGLELTKMEESLIHMQSARQDMTVAFNTLLSRDISDSVQVPADMAYAPLLRNRDSMIKMAQARNPELQAAKKIIEKDSLNHLLAKTSKIPDFNGSVWYGQRAALNPEGNKAPDILGLTVGITLPVYSRHKQDPMIAESEFDFQKSQYRYKALNNVIKQQVSQAFIALDKNGKLISLYTNQLIPQAVQNMNAGVIAYQENKTDFLTLTDNFLSLYTYRLQYYQAVADYMKAGATLDMLTAKRLFNHP